MGLPLALRKLVDRPRDHSAASTRRRSISRKPRFRPRANQLEWQRVPQSLTASMPPLEHDHSRAFPRARRAFRRVLFPLARIPQRQTWLARKQPLTNGCNWPGSVTSLLVVSGRNLESDALESQRPICTLAHMATSGDEYAPSPVQQSTDTQKHQPNARSNPKAASTGRVLATNGV